MNILFLGDVVGSHGCNFVESKIRGIKREYAIDFTVINGENSADGNGITPRSARRLFHMGADVITTGNHCFRRREVMDMYESCGTLLRPANFPEGNAGRGVCVFDMGSARIAVINLMGTLYLEALDNPFTVVDKLLADIDTPNIFVDLHAEATSEKKAMGHYLTGRFKMIVRDNYGQEYEVKMLIGYNTKESDLDEDEPFELTNLSINSQFTVSLCELMENYSFVRDGEL